MLKSLLFQTKSKSLKEGPLGSVSSTLFTPSNKFGVGGIEQLANPKSNKSLVDPEEEEKKKVYPGDKPLEEPLVEEEEALFEFGTDPNRILYRDMPGMKQNIVPAQQRYVPYDTMEYDPEEKAPEMSDMSITNLTSPTPKVKKVGVPSLDNDKGIVPNSYDPAEWRGNKQTPVSVIDTSGKQNNLSYRVDWMKMVDKDAQKEDPNFMDSEEENVNLTSNTKLVKPHRFVPKVVTPRDKMMNENKKEKLGYEPEESETLDDLVSPEERADGDKVDVDNEKEAPEFDRGVFKLGTILWPKEHSPKNVLLSEEAEILEEGFWDWLKGLWYKLMGYGASEKPVTRQELRKDFTRTLLRAKRIYFLALDYGVEDEELTDFIEKSNTGRISENEFISLVKSKKLDKIIHRVRERTSRAINKSREGNGEDNDE
jgi:hypothetical protein